MIPINIDLPQTNEYSSDNNDYVYEVKIKAFDININIINNNKQKFISNLEKIYNNNTNSDYNIDNIKISTDKKILYICFDISTSEYSDIVDLGRINEIYKINFDSLPAKLNIDGNLFIINKYLDKGGQATIYEGNYINNGGTLPVIFWKGKYEEIPDMIKHYFGKEYIIFDTSDNKTVTIMERLYPLIFNENIFEQSLQFLDDIKKYNLGHGDATPNNIMMDINGNMKLIDYTPGNTYTKLYDKNDRMYIPLSLYEIKNHNKIIQFAKDILDDINKEIEKLPEQKKRLFTFLTDMGNSNHSKFNKFILESDIDLVGSLYILQLLHFTRLLIVEANNIIDGVDFNFNLYTGFNLSDMDDINPIYNMLDNLGSKYNLRYTLYKKDFIIWLLDNINNDRYDDTYLKFILEEIDR